MKKAFRSIGKWIIRGVSRLPLGVLYGLSSVCYLVVYYMARYRRKIVTENLLRIFPHKTDKERKRIAQRFYRHLCDLFVETLKALTISNEELSERFIIRNPEEANQYIDAGRSVLVYGAHFGNWEWLIITPRYLRGQYRTFFQPQKNVMIDELTYELRSRNGITPVASLKAFRHMVQCMNDGLTTTTLTIGDQSPHSGAQKCWVDFFGHDTAFLVGPVTIARYARQTLVYPSLRQKKRGYYEVHLTTIATVEEVEQLPLQAIVERYAAMLEDDIRLQPWIWLLSHNRWKHNHEDFPEEPKK